MTDSASEVAPPSAEQADDPVRDDERRPRTPWAIGGLVALVVARAVVHASQGAHLVLDDWSLAYYGRADFWEALDSGFRTSRPGAWLSLTVVHGLADGRPLVLLGVLTVLNAVFVVLLYLLADRYVPRAAAIAVPAVWVLMASHTSLTVWGSTVPTVLALCLLAGGVLLLDDGRWPVATVCLCAAGLTYELVLPAAVVAALVVGRGVRGPARAAMVVALGATGLWMSTHSIYPVDPAVPPVDDLWDSLFGRGLLGNEDPAEDLRLLLLWTSLAVAVAGLLAIARGHRDRGSGPWLIVVGSVLVALGTMGWVNLGDLSVPLGHTDRINAIAALGAAAIWVGAGMAAWSRGWRVPTAAAATAFGAVLAVGNVATMASWSAAGDDVDVLFDHLEVLFPYAESRDHVVGPDPEAIRHDGVFALGAEGFADAAGRLSIGDGQGSVTVAAGPDAFADTPGILVDWSDVLGGEPYPFAERFPGSPVGAADARPDGQTVVFSGWAVDPSAPDVPVTVALRVDGQVIEVVADGPGPAGADRPDGVAEAHGFRAVVEVGPGLVVACAVARDADGGTDVPLPITGPEGPRTTWCVGVPD